MKKLFVFFVLILPTLATAQYKAVTKKTDIGTDGKATTTGRETASQDEAIQEVPNHHVQKQEFKPGPYKNVKDKWDYNYKKDESDEEEETEP